MPNRDWPTIVRRRNRRELIAAVLVGVWVLWRDGLGLRSWPLLGAVLWVGYVMLIRAEWRADPVEGDAGVRRELVRQGELLRRAWLWYVAPLLIGAALLRPPGMFGAVALALFGIVLSIVNFVVGTKLIREARTI